LKQIAVLGSTGSIGVSTLRIVADKPDQFRVATLVAGSNIDLLEQQIEQFHPEFVSVRDRETAEALLARSPACRVGHGPDGAVEAAEFPEVELVVGGLVGAIGLRPIHAALDLGRDVALANKEALVVAGAHMTRLAEKRGANILPVDSEHNALHQCLRGERVEEVRHLWLTASGGPFRQRDAASLAAVTPHEALQHPTWKMGPKITIDSATLMNKGLEVIEAHWLFGVPAERIRVVVHPGSVVHSMVEFVDGSFKAQLGVTDMRHPIQYAMTWPERQESTLPAFDPLSVAPLEFFPPDTERFPCLDLAFRALEHGGAAPAVLNAANEVAVQEFLDGVIGFTTIPLLIAQALDRHAGEAAGSIDDLLRADARARATVAQCVAEGVRP